MKGFGMAMGSVLDRKVRIFRKTMEAQCQTCGNRQVGLIRLFGTSYLDDFEGVPDKEAQKFWEDMPAGLNAKKLESYIVNIITEQKIHRELDEVKGKFLPLEVWAAKGFNVEDIEKNTTEEDQETHPVLGKTYRVNIRATSTIHLWERIRMEAHKHVENMKSLRQNNVEDSRDRSRSGDRDRSRSRRATRSRSRSARSSKDPMRAKMEKQLEEKLSKERQRILDKEAALKARKEERERENLEKKEKQDKAKVYNSIRSQASRCIPSLAPLRFTLEAAKSEQSFKKVPKVLKQEVTDCAATIVRWITEAETKQKASAPDPLSFSLDELKEFVKGG